MSMPRQSVPTSQPRPVPSTRIDGVGICSADSQGPCGPTPPPLQKGKTAFAPFGRVRKFCLTRFIEPDGVDWPE